MQHIFWSILPIFLITLMGSVIKNKWITSDEFWRGLEKLSYFLLFPILLFNYISTADLGAGALTQLIWGLIISSLIVGGGLALYQNKYNIDKSQFTSIFQGSVRYNSYIFFALGKSLYGDEGLVIVSVVSAYMIIFTNALSVFIFVHYLGHDEKDEDSRPNLTILVKRCAVNPLIIASILGFMFNYADLTLNIGIKNTLQSLSNAALAMGILNVGAGLRFVVNLYDIKYITITSVVKLLIFPIITMIILSFTSIGEVPKAIGILYSGLPCASTSYVLSKQFGGDYKLMASIITITTIFSVLSLSLLLYILG
jgi:malonate transporter and related proteins